MSDLSVNFAGVKMRCPIGPASLTSHSCPREGLPERYASWLMKLVKEGAGYVHTSLTVKEHPMDLRPSARWLKIETPGFGKESLIDVVDTRRILINSDTGSKIIEILKEKLPEDVPVIANVGGAEDPKEWAETARIMEEAGADLIEINSSCPGSLMKLEQVKDYITKGFTGNPLQLGALVGDSPELLEKIVKTVVKRVRIPTGVKLTPETGFPRYILISKMIKRCGCKFISAINNPTTIAPPDIYREGKPLYPFFDANPIGGYIGPATRLLCYRNVGTISLYVPGIDIAGIGGLVAPKHFIEVMMLGAKIAEASSGICWLGKDLIRRSVDFLKKFVEQQGYETVEDFVGIGLKYVKSVSEVDWKVGKVVAKTDEMKCNGCGICANTICFARYMENGIAKVDEETCSACGQCVAVCPAGACYLTSKK